MSTQTEISSTHTCQNKGCHHAPLTLERINAKQITVGVVGLGYVGLPLSLTMVEEGVSVIGFDIDIAKIEALQKGSSYYKHIDAARVASSIESKRLLASSDYSQICKCDVVVICVPTPLDHHLEPDLSYISQTCESIAEFIAPHTLVSLESTTWPGTTEEVVKPIIESKGTVRLDEDLYLSFSPEREDPGNKEYTTKTIPKLVGGSNRKSLELAQAFYSLSIDNVIAVGSTRVAEASKLFENIFRGVNIALVNEMKIICDSMNIDVWEVIKAASTKPFGYMPFSPGPGLGGHCIPIDPYYLSWKAREFGVATRFIELAGEINRSMPLYVVSKVQDCLNLHEKSVKGSKILVLGVAYKADIDDMRESPSLKLMELLLEKGAIVNYHDPYFPEIGSTREYQFLKGMQSRNLSSDYDCFLLATDHSCFSPQEILSYGVPCVDTRNFLSKHDNVYKA
ncbi:MAG: nucleotide sugar dehydrogenase [Chlamydiota bacterium]|nr:nucleotide sugar dehydrogenase [Chlamydiota bacterium]